MRNIKTGIGVMLCVLAGNFIIENPMYAGVGCVVSIQDTFKGSVKLGFNRALGTFLGGLVGFLSLFIGHKNPIVCGLGVMLTIYGCTFLKVNSGIVVASVTFLSINLGVIDTSPIDYSLQRVFDTSIGVLIGILVNLIGRPDYYENSISEIDKIENMIEKSLENKVTKNDKFNISAINKQIKTLEGIYLKLLDEIKYSKEDIDIDFIKHKIDNFKEIIHHMQSIEFLKEELFINNENNHRLINKYPSIVWGIDDEKSPVFNYHLLKIIELVYIT